MNINKKRVISLVFLSLILFSAIIPIAAAADDTSFFGSLGKFFSDIITAKFGEKPTDIIVAVIITLILFAGLYDILELISIFQLAWVKLVIAAGITLIGVQFEFPLKIMKIGGIITASLGAIGIILEIIIAIIIFFGLVIGNQWLAQFAARRKGQVEQIKAIKSADEAAAAMQGLRRFQKETTKKRP